jgi:G patch domain-containing protein 1
MSSGWTPQTFVSSRSDRAKKKAARPEDFMDEEDLQDLQDSRKIVDTTDEMDLTSGPQTDPDDTNVEYVYLPFQLFVILIVSSPLTVTLQSAMLPPSKDSAGAHILKKMGWRVGQGIGPRITLKQRRLQDSQASNSTGFAAPTNEADVSLDDDEEEANKHTYAPRDTPILIVECKDDTHGLGYRPGMSLNERLGVKDSGSANTGPKISCKSFRVV